MKLARAIHFDESDQRVFASPARTGECCISGGFEFSNWTEGDLVGKARQAFSNGWFGLETGGQVKFVAITKIKTLTNLLAGHFITFYGSPSIKAAGPVARDEIAQMIELCEDHDANTLLTVAQHLTEAGVREAYRVIEAQEAELSQFAIHGDTDHG